MAADRGAFIDQSQSFNAFMATPTKAKVTSMHFYAWKKGLKTGAYFFNFKYFEYFKFSKFSQQFLTFF